MTASFDETADRYADLVDGSISFAGQEHDYFVRRKVDVLVDLARTYCGDPAALDVLDVGCGVGSADRHLEGVFGHLVGCDPSFRSIVQADHTVSGAGYVGGDAAALPFGDGVVDLAFVINVMHHVEPANRGAVMAEVARVVRAGGMVVVFEHNPLNPLTRLSVGRCEFDDGVELLWPRELRRRVAAVGLAELERRYVVFTPFDSPWQHRLEDRLGWLALGAQYFVAARRH